MNLPNMLNGYRIINQHSKMHSLQDFTQYVNWLQNKTLHEYFTVLVTGDKPRLYNTVYVTVMGSIFQYVLQIFNRFPIRDLQF